MIKIIEQGYKKIVVVCDYCNTQINSTKIPSTSLKCNKCGKHCCNNHRIKLTSRLKLKKYTYKDTLEGYVCRQCMQEGGFINGVD